MPNSFLDITGLGILWDRITTKVSNHGKEIPTNDKFGHIKSILYHSKSSTGITPSTDAISIAVNNRTNTAGRFYAIETDSNGFAFVNVPWTDTKNAGTVTSITLTQGAGITVSSSGTAITSSGTRTISLKQATSGELGGIKIGYTESGKNYPVELDSSGKAFVNVPWTDSNTNYYPTAFAWTNGTTAGPTGRLTGSGMGAVSFGAIPSASATSSGIVTTGAQTFAGAKTFSDNILPKTGSDATLGTDSQPWSAAYITTVHGSLDGNAKTATTAANLTAAPSLAASGNNITVTAGGKTSAVFTVPYATSAGSVTWANVSGKPSSFTPSTHTHAYTQLTGSTTTANQAIVSSGTANKWTLKTLGSNAFNSTVIPTKVSQLTNDSGFITNSSLSGYLPLSGGTLTGQLTGTTIAANTLKAVNNAQLTLSADGTMAKGFIIDNASSSFRPTSQNTTSSLGTSTYQWENAYIETVHGSLDGNASTSDKLKTARTISLGTAVTSTATQFDGSKNITIPVTGINEAYVNWGGRNISSSYSPIDASMIAELGANRFAYPNPDSITIEYTRDGGSTWVNYTSSDVGKQNLFSPVGSGYRAGNPEPGTIPTNKYQLRVTIDSELAEIYTQINKFAIYVSTSGSSGCTVTIEKALASSPTVFIPVVTDVPIAGWSGWNIINAFTSFTTYSNSPTTQYKNIRFTFKITSHSSSYPGNSLSVQKIYGFGGMGWTAPSELAKTGHIYKFLSNQGAEFPGDVTPSGNKTANLGLSSYQWSTIWGGTIYENGQTLSSKYALKSEIPDNVGSITNSEIDEIFA